jgi:hypothetical protein
MVETVNIPGIIYSELNKSSFKIIVYSMIIWVKSEKRGDV